MRMKVKYRHYEPDLGLEELQAKVYSEVSGLPTSAKEIKERIQGDKRDPKMIRYALTDEKEILAYVQARDSPIRLGRTAISYPWALQECPKEVQYRLFDDLVAYLRKRQNTKEIITGVVLRSLIKDQQLKFFQEKGFFEKERISRYISDYDIRELVTWKISEEITEFTSRLGTLDDLDQLIDLIQRDSYTSLMLPTSKAITDYLKKKVLKDGHLILIFEDDLLVAARAPLLIEPDNNLIKENEGERVIIRFSAIRPGYQTAWKRLLIEISKECAIAGWSEIPLRAYFWFFAMSPPAMALVELDPKFEVLEIILGLDLKERGDDQL